MDGWIDGWMDGWMDGSMDRWIDGWMDGTVAGTALSARWLACLLKGQGTRDKEKEGFRVGGPNF